MALELHYVCDACGIDAADIPNAPPGEPFTRIVGHGIGLLSCGQAQCSQALADLVVAAAAPLPGDVRTTQGVATMISKASTPALGVASLGQSK